MVSNFDKAVARAAAERSALDKVKTIQEREHAEKVKLAHSIIDPYLAELGSKVVAVLRELRIPPEGRYRCGNYHTITEFWRFCSFSHPENYETFALNSEGKFASYYHNSQVTPIIVGLIEGHRISWKESNNIGYTVMLANADDQKTYAKRGYDKSNPVLQELSEFMADFIYKDMKR